MRGKKKERTTSYRKAGGHLRPEERQDRSWRLSLSFILRKNDSTLAVKRGRNLSKGKGKGNFVTRGVKKSEGGGSITHYSHTKPKKSSRDESARAEGPLMPLSSIKSLHRFEKKREKGGKILTKKKKKEGTVVFWRMMIPLELLYLQRGESSLPTVEKKEETHIVKNDQFAGGERVFPPGRGACPTQKKIDLETKKEESGHSQKATEVQFSKNSVGRGMGKFQSPEGGGGHHGFPLPRGAERIKKRRERPCVRPKKKEIGSRLERGGKPFRRRKAKPGSFPRRTRPPVYLWKRGKMPNN